MTLTAPKSESKRVLVPQGTHIARCINLIHVGTVAGEYMGQAKIFNKMRLTFEFPEETHVFTEGEDAKPIVLSQEYTLSMAPKAKLRPLVEGMIGTSLNDDEATHFDHETLVGMPCLLSVIQRTSKKGTKYAVISSASPLMKGQVCKEAFNPYKILNYTDKFDEAYFNTLPDFIKSAMMTSKEYKALKGIETDEIDPLDIPF